MMDRTTDGYTVDDDEIQRMLRNLCGYALGEPDPLERYRDLTHQQVLFDGLVAALRRERGHARAALTAGGALALAAPTVAHALTVPREDAGWCDPALEIAAARHERAFARLFIS